TSALWVAFSVVSVTDIPLSATFAAAMLLGMRWLSSGDRRWLVGVAALFGLAVTAKGLVPLALGLPLLWMGRRRLPDLFRPLPVAVFLAVALPWYLMCGLQNGSAFWDELFGRHHFARFAGGVMLHPRPFWFYVPVLAAGFHPWTPLVAPLLRKSFYSDPRRRFLLLWAAFGFLFLSASTGKLPGYILPLLPALAALAGIALDQMKNARWLLASCCLLLSITPVVGRSFPRALADGLSRSPVEGWSWGFAAACLAAGTLIWWLESGGKRSASTGLLLASVVLCAVLLKVDALPELDRLVSGRTLWRKVSTSPDRVCVDQIHRIWRYSLNYYSVSPLPECREAPRPLRIRQIPGAPPFVE
ncbi:MAG TPA: hypothetical protein VLH09_15135, partial [Bryobacteraceae bacterium]|nr:hypothetical protein [Bryobacteraceae bacterium]